MITEATTLLDKAKKALRTADHMVYITYPLIKETRLLKSVLEQLYSIAADTINAILHYEYAYKRIRYFSPAPLAPKSQNWDLFEKCSIRFGITSQELEGLKQLLELMIKHQTSSVEFTRKDRLVFMSGNARTESIGLDQLKSHLNVLKTVLDKAKAKICEPLW